MIDEHYSPAVAEWVTHVLCATLVPALCLVLVQSRECMRA